MELTVAGTAQDSHLIPSYTVFIAVSPCDEMILPNRLQKYNNLRRKKKKRRKNGL